jgi:drug/metabolite transporter (DMT)-like permease
MEIMSASLANIFDDEYPSILIIDIFRRREHMTRKAWVLFALISVFWGIPYLFIKIAVQELDPIVVVFARVGIAAAVLLPVAVYQGMLRPLRGHWRTIILLSCIQIMVPFLLISYGEQLISSSLTSILIASEPLLVALLALRFDQSEQVRGLRFIGLLIGIVGVIVLLGLDVSGDVHQLLGAVMVLLATTGYAAGALLIKQPRIASLPSLGVIAAECLVSTVVLLPLGLMRLPHTMPAVNVLVSLLILGLICTALAWLTLFALVAEAGASRGTVFTYVNPVVAVLLGVTFLDDPLTITIVIGFLLIIIGSWFSTGGVLPFMRSKTQNHC